MYTLPSDAELSANVSVALGEYPQEIGADMLPKELAAAVMLSYGPQAA
jgi:hypothetical protein